jgi:hypothetical protein
MVSKCANPACSAPFLYLHEGRIFFLRGATAATTDVADAVVERYWLCGDCAETLTLVLRDDRVALQPLPARAPVHSATAAPRQRQSAA